MSNAWRIEARKEAAAAVAACEKARGELWHAIVRSRDVGLPDDERLLAIEACDRALYAAADELFGPGGVLHRAAAVVRDAPLEYNLDYRTGPLGEALAKFAAAFGAEAARTGGR